MSIYSLIFSNNSSYRFSRHAIFWLAWIAYYTIFGTYGHATEHPLLNRFYSSLLEISFSTPLDMIFCYSIIYFLLPKVLFKGRYLSMIVLWLLFSVLFITVFELYAITIVPHIRGWFGLPPPMMSSAYGYVFFSLFSQINMEGCMTAAIKLGKISFIKQKEIDLLRNEKSNLQTKTNKAEMQPVLLADIMSRLENMAIQKPSDVPAVLKKIRNLMINMMYENTYSKVSVERELELVNEYIDLELCTMENAPDIKLNVSGNMESESVASFILLQCIQGAFNQLSAIEVAHKQLTINITVVNKILDMMISWNKPLYTSTLGNGNIIPENLNNRLKLIYPQSHEIKILIEVEKIILLLKIDLKGAINS